MDPQSKSHPVPGELTVYHVRDIARDLLHAFTAGVRAFDLSGVSEMDTAGYQVLVSLCRLADARGETIALQRPSVVACEVFATAGWRGSAAESTRAVRP